MMRFFIIFICVSLTACASKVTYEPIVDFKKVDRNEYSVDLAECQQYAQEVQNDIILEGVASALVGAAAGLAVGNITGSDTGNAAVYGATLGAGAGGANAAASHIMEKEQIVDNCLVGRGYKVLGKR